MYFKSIVIKKRTLGLAALVVVGLGLIGLGWLNGQSKFLSRHVSAPADNNSSSLQVNNTGGFKTNSNDVGVAGNVNGSKPQQSNNEAVKDVLTDKNKKTSEFFVEYRLQREKMRGQRVELLREIINNQATSADSRQKAQDQLLVISSNINKETEVENLIRAKGFKDCVVFLQNQSVTVIVQSEEITSEDAARISDIVSRSTGISAQNVVTIPKP
ncbi:hypothetical protein Dtox_2604 [Desulfofarcimen acetoxidans DSM 771]|jgi:stage III sporulation protein AH|uniref:Stage III sporulation protein AH n=1 Tax=Desulfofarcimen acetoxidans (strain ATCC 49208 / DSM 771 / KCTC 5769 / VKM B-1644 / 5575) TaxID=485916 RepID=C8W101_DESAS|nr:SpoIIIAH-like family protein [Desulfofarcimen acetoxidans]ACV63397.1 hypothetical protein Dtox_2604 [Desulfofarcimen acetoxidans DSM 771]